MMRRQEHFFFRHLMRIALAVLTLFTLLAAFIFYAQGQASNTARGWVLHTYEVTGHIQLLFNRLKDVELGQRGYMIAGDDAYLAPYRDALKNSLGEDAASTRLEQHHSIAEEMAILRKLTRDSPVQQQNLDELDDFIKDLLAYWAADVENRRIAGNKMPLDNAEFQKENQRMDQLRKLVGIMMAEENQLLEKRAKAAQASMEQDSWLTFCGIAFFYLLMSSAIWLAGRLLNEKLRAQVDLKHQKELLENLIEALPIPLFAKNAANGYRFILWNAKAEEMFGMPRASILGTTDYDHFPSDEADGFRATDENIMAAGTIVDIPRETITGPHGRWLSHTRKVPVYDGQHRPSVLFGILEDITEREAMDRLKNEFVSTVSHELRTPLTSIRGSLGLILAGVGGVLPEQSRNLVSIAFKNCERLILLINDILDMEGLESGQLHFDLELVSIGSLIEQAVELNKPYGDKFNIQLVITRPLPQAQIHVDNARFMQIMSNLLSNAVKFSSSGNQVELAAGIQGSHAIITVTDHGQGIPDAFKSRIFGKFAQADSSDTKSKAGTGLGLNITKAIVEKLGGQIDFTSTFGEGTRFTLTFPVAAMASQATRSFGNEIKNRILVCEDDACIAELLKANLEQHGFIVDVAFSARQANELLTSNGYMAMTLDIMLPDKDGLAFFRELRAREATRTLPIIIVSAKAQDDLVSGQALGVIDWLVKPIDTHRLIAAVQRIVDAGSKPVVLHVEDDEDIAQLTALSLNDIATVVQVRSLKEAQRALAAQAFDLVLLDVALPDGSGLTLLKSLNRSGDKPIPVIIFSANELLPEASKNVAAALIKAKTTDTQIISTIMAHIYPRQPDS